MLINYLHKEISQTIRGITWLVNQKDLINQPAAGYRGHFIRPRGFLPQNSPLRFTNGVGSQLPILAIISVILAFILPPAGFILGYISRRLSLKKNDSSGTTLSKVALIVGGVFTLLEIFVCAAFVVILIGAH